MLSVTALSITPPTPSTRSVRPAPTTPLPWEMLDVDELLVEMVDIAKSFPGVRALENAQFELRRGEVHALVGENGAGKSTLMKILAGIYRRDAGVIRVRGVEQEINS